MEGAKLMLETHLLMRKDEPPVVTLILVDSRVLLLLGWLNDVKNFILLDTDFDPIVIDCDAVRTSSLCDGKSDLSLSKLPNSIQAREQTISLKVTLKGCDLCLIESPQSLNSLALIGHGSADLSMSDPHGKLTAHLEIKEFNLCWCLMSSEVMSRCQLTNDFKATAELLPEVATSLKQEATKLLRGSSVAVESGYRIKIDFGDSLVGRFSYRDFLVVHGVLQLSMKNLLHSLSQSAIPTHTAEKDNGLLNITRIQVASKAASLWLLDDFQGTAFPLLRILLKDLLLEKYLDKMSSSFCLAIDYFNQRIFGWEPLLEPWVVRHLLFISKDISDDKLRSSWSRTTVEFHAVYWLKKS
ncbi:hypothetical protein AB6A40_011041 [Gnathostoma spinigerum]|uniref:Uncharacterized protein n=1 Tax=Gnathostoma spinigerum TaxID=75299 RepID=A0ABD6F3G9_9BILA